ncbi:MULTISPECIES: dCTP deaminase [unclassified Kribbella]|uniref:dCTP deaminase n=1 Tax=unclassified Kribbella TaxID=2644121 RepID=UPI00301AA22F
MAPSFGHEAYLTTLHQRIEAFRSYLTALSGEISGADPVLRSAIDSFIEYTEKLEDQSNQLIIGDVDLFSALQPYLIHLRNVEKVADQLFSRGHAVAVPRSLRSAATRELRQLGLDNRRPVIVIGPPQNFETFITDLRDYMFSILDLVEVRPSSEVLAMICLPYLEGTQALWQPVTMGHELAHLAESEHSVVASLDSDTWITREMVDDIDFERLPTWLDASLDIVQEVREVLKSWIREVVCDLHTIRRFGPAGFAAIAEFLSSIGALYNVSVSHPPGSFRIYCMCRLLGEDLGAYVDVVGTWREFESDLLEEPERELPAILSSCIRDHFDLIKSAAESLTSATYDWRGRQEIAVELSKSLIEYIPAVDSGDPENGRARQEDLLNAGWLARVHHERKIPRQVRSRALVMLDRVISKSLSDLDFLSLWDEAGTALAEDQGADNPGEDFASSESGLSYGPVLDQSPPVATGALPADEIMRRLRPSVPIEATPVAPIIVTPFFTAAAQGAALDLRLSTKFIIFRRAGTPMFDSLDPDQDPREMQELVEKDWAGQFILHPLELVLAATHEYISMPPDLTAQVITRSSHGRLGLLSATAVQVHPYFRGCLTLELVNLGQMPLALTPGERIAQLVFYPVKPAPSEPSRKYDYPTGPQFSRVRHDRDLNRLRTMRNLRRTTMPYI